MSEEVLKQLKMCATFCTFKPSDTPSEMLRRIGNPQVRRYHRSLYNRVEPFCVLNMKWKHAENSLYPLCFFQTSTHSF